MTNYPHPEPQSGQVLIRIRATGLNRSDLFTKQGHSTSVKFLRILGIVAVGEVVDNGSDEAWKPGDKVMAITNCMGRDFDGS